MPDEDGCDNADKPKKIRLLACSLNTRAAPLLRADLHLDGAAPKYRRAWDTAKELQDRP